MSEEEIIKYAKIFSTARGDTFKIHFDDRTINEPDVWKGVLEYIEKLQNENEELQDLKAELHAEVIKNHYLEDKVKVYEQQIDLEWVEENYIEKRILKRAEKIIDLMAEQMSKRPLMIFQGNEKENSVKILKEPKEIIDYYTKKAEE